MHLWTKYNSSQPRLLSRQETLIKVHVHHLHKHKVVQVVRMYLNSMLAQISVSIWCHWDTMS